MQMYLSDIFTISANLAGIPGMSVPCGYTKSGLPIGVQFLAGHFQEGRLIQIASAYETQAKIEKRRPAL
jgi:aspartyl-tRNA(Asn)/glutamyl-tRNA(Gln) amidotransferase subunit A